MPPSRDAVEALRDWADRPLPDEPALPLSVLAELDDAVAPATMASPGPRFFGWVHGGSLPATVAASWLAAAWDQNAFAFQSSPGTVLVEELVLDWVREALGLPEGVAGTFATGATAANFTALAAARHRVLARAGRDVERDRLFGAPPVTLATSAESHPTVRKALGLLGFGCDRVVALPVDEQGRIAAARLLDLDGPPVVCAQARRFADGLRAAGYEVLNDVVLNQVVLCFADAARTAAR